jgi:hypothetical protein
MFLAAGRTLLVVMLSVEPRAVERSCDEVVRVPALGE